jgi:hypothetical protein
MEKIFLQPEFLSTVKTLSTALNAIWGYQAYSMEEASVRDLGNLVATAGGQPLASVMVSQGIDAPERQGFAVGQA